MYQSIPVCMYHHVNDNPDKYLTVSVKNFRAQMELLHREGFTTLSSSEFMAYKKGVGRFPRKSVLLTFDDAWLDVFVNAFPILKQLNLKFTLFVISERAKRASMFSPHFSDKLFPSHHEAEQIAETPDAYTVVCGWKHLREMIDSGLCSVENHTATHGHLDDIMADIQEGKEAIESCLGVATRQLAWPRGKYNRDKLKVARDLGIEVAYTTRRGINLPFIGTMKVKRFTVDDHGADWFKRSLTIFSSPLYGYLYARLKPDRKRRKITKWLRCT
ncbi:MAG: hypothetical protein DRH12_15555 [Deltaproteobacteria bacterium]|nr:MAG: hypothetical protein DRH12_15555 [Deltaproteobacteria bacterium]